MTIQSLGVGSGLALDDLVSQLLEAERTPKQNRLDAREEKIDAEISSLGKVKSKLSDFKDAVDDLRKDTSISGREPTITNPNEDTEVLTAEASNSALEGSYQVKVESLAGGSRIETNEFDAGGFQAATDPVLSSASGSLTFKINGTGDSFTVGVSDGMTLAQLREAINKNENNFGVSANLIDTGRADGGVKLVITSDVMGEGNDLSIVNDNDLSDLERIATTNSLEDTSYLPLAKLASDAVAYIDGIEVRSQSNEFENTIQNVSFTAETISPKDADGELIASTLKIGFDKQGTEDKIRKFIENYNSLMSEITTLTKYGESDLEDDGALAGDSMIRGIQNGLSNILGDNVSKSTLGGIFQLGIEIDSDGKLEISDVDFGLGSGEDRLSDALEDAFDEVSKLFTDEDEGIATRLYDFIHSYTRSGGLISLREQAAKDNQEQVYDDRERLELRMLNYEEILRDKYLNLDQTVAKLNSTGSALLAALG